MKNDIPAIIHAALFGFCLNAVIRRAETGDLDYILFPAVIAVISATIVAISIRLNSLPNALGMARHEKHPTKSDGL